MIGKIQTRALYFGDTIYRAYIIKGGTSQARQEKRYELAGGDHLGAITGARNENEIGIIFYTQGSGDDETRSVTLEGIRRLAGEKQLGKDFKIPGTFVKSERYGIIDLDA